MGGIHIRERQTHTNTDTHSENANRLCLRITAMGHDDSKAEKNPPHNAFFTHKGPAPQFSCTAIADEL